MSGVRYERTEPGGHIHRGEEAVAQPVGRRVLRSPRRMTVTEGYVEAQVGRIEAEIESDLVTAIRESDRTRFRETMWLAGLIFAMIASATGLIIAVLLSIR